MERYTPYFDKTKQKPSKKINKESRVLFPGNVKQKPKGVERRKPWGQNSSVKTAYKNTYREAEVSHKDSIMNLADQITKYLDRHKDRPNAAVNDVSMGLFLGFSEFYAHDGDPNSNGIQMLSKVIEKVKTLAKEYDDLIPEREDDFDLDSAADEVLSDDEESDNEEDTSSEDDIATDDEEESDIEEEDDEENTKTEKKESKKVNHLHKGLGLHPDYKSSTRESFSEGQSIENFDLNRFMENDSDVEGL